MRPVAVVFGGVLYALALPPFDWAVCGWLTLAPLLWVLRGQSAATAFRYGVLYGYVSGWAVTWCFAEAAMRYFELPFPLAVAALALWYLVVCGLPFGLFAAASAVIWRFRRLGPALLLIPAAWVASEFFRGRVMGQPWGLLGYTQHAQLPLLPIVGVTGVYGVSFVLAYASTILAELIHHVTTRQATTRREPATVLVPVAIVSACCAVAGWGGALADRPEAPLHRVAIVQTNVAPSLHWTRAYTDAQVAAHLRATAELPPGAADLIVWPENSVPRYLENEPLLAVQLAAMASRQRADLLFGGPRHEQGRTFNTARLITAAGRNGGHYDKRRLVLFAEEKPLASSPGAALPESPEQFSPGAGSGVLASIVPIGVSICHEIVHPDVIADSVRDGAEMLVNIANDGWLDAGGNVAAPQHLAMAVFRAVETGRYVVRAATTGPSAVIDPHGRIVGLQPAGTAGVLTADVRGDRSLTPYVRFGDAFAVLCMALTCLAMIRRPVPVALVQPEALQAPAST